jgi:hypothetical protein
MVNYQNGKIYKIVNLETEICYIGSTCQTLDQRLRDHKSEYKKYLLGKAEAGYTSSFEILKNDDHDIVLIENYPCETQAQVELLVRERYWTNKNCCVNHLKNQGIYLQLGGKKGYAKYYNEKYHEEHREEIHAKMKAFREEKREEINEKSRIKFECKCGAICRINEKARHERSNRHQKFININ